jgi:dephospho-CoA kinase
MIIAVTGKTGAGKTTFAKAIAPKLNAQVRSFSEGPRAVVSLVTGLAFDSNWNGLKNEKLPADWWNAITGRSAVNKTAEHLKDIFGRQVWANHLLTKYSTDRMWIIDDLRFLVEEEALQKFPHKIVRVICEEETEENPSDYDVPFIKADITINRDNPAHIESFMRMFTLSTHIF